MEGVISALRSQARPSVTHCLFLLSGDPDVEVSAISLVPSLPACLHVSCHDDNGLNI